MEIDVLYLSQAMFVLAELIGGGLCIKIKQALP